MMMTIRDKNDLRIAYYMVHTMADTIAKATNMDLAAVEGMVRACDTIKEIKREIRTYNHEQDAKPAHTIVKDYGMDGYIELYELPDVSDPEAYFDENERLLYRPSQYDCTGQVFTAWHKIIKRRGRNMVYHRVAIDV